MPTQHPYIRARWLLLMALAIGCDRESSVAPSDEGVFITASATGSGLSAVSNLSATAVSASQVDLTWQDNATNETGFEVHRSTTGASGAFNYLATTTADVASYADGGLIAARLYCYRVRAFKRSGRKMSYTAFSAASCATTATSEDPPPPPPPPLAAPSNTRARPSSANAITIAWSDILAETGFRVERSLSSGSPWTTVTTTGANVVSAIDAGRVSDQQVCYRVIAFNGTSESAPSNTDCTAIPAGPTNLIAASTAQGIDLAWSDNSVVEGSYRVDRSVDGVNFGYLAYVPENSTSYHDSGASIAIAYWYRVSANKDGGLSDFSNVASAQGSCTATSESEVCDNGTDDDCDGAVDLADYECASIPFDCGFDHCPPSYVCGYDGFCISHCADGQRNGTEGDVDCGGDCSTKCQLGQQCGLNYDCASGFCYYGICRTPGGTP